MANGFADFFAGLANIRDTTPQGQRTQPFADLVADINRPNSRAAKARRAAVTPTPTAPVAPTPTTPVAPAPTPQEVAEQEFEQEQEALDRQLERQIEQERQKEERTRQEAARQEQQRVTDFEQGLGQAFQSGIGGAENYFTQQGVDPSLYREDITSEAERRRSGIPQFASDPGSYFSGLGEDVYGSLSEGLRSRSLQDVNRLAPSDIAQTRIADTADDEIINAILGEQRVGAEEYANRLFDRGVITDRGLEGALGDIERQAGLGGARLQEIGGGILGTGRSGVNEFISQGRTGASQADLASGFDVGGFEQELEKQFSDFFGNLAGSLRGQAPTDLFDTSGLGTIAGAAQGAGNTAFNPKAIGGLGEEEEEEEDDNFGVF